MTPLPSPNPYAAPTNPNRALPGVWQDSSARKAICASAVGLSLCLFLASLTQDAYYTTEGQAMPGVVMFILGWIAVFDFIPTWLANPLVIIAWPLLFFRRTRYLALFFAGAALALALSFLMYESLPNNPRRDFIASYGAAYWLWMASMLVATLGAVASVVLGREPKASEANA